jgi:crotonobetainyl-CoA:carnitine CoA-transferase CaiB-like acyl-CoA transferase
VIAGNDGQFVKLCSVLGVPGLAEDPRFTDNRSRTANREALRPLLEEQLGRRTKSEWFDALIAVGVPCGPINSIKQGVELAESLGLTPTVATGDGDAGSARCVTPLSSHEVPFATTCRHQRSESTTPSCSSG